MRIATMKVGRLTTRLLPPSQALVVSLHDVSPHTRADCEKILTELRSLGVKCCSLLVVPDFHRRGHFLSDESFCEWLLGLAEQKHEIVIHGYHHLRERRADETMMQKLTTRVYTADEGEFYDLDYEAASALVEQAREDFRSIGLAPEGFIAPAWLLSAEGERALRDAGIQYTTRLKHVRDLHSGRTYESQSLVWSTRSLPRRQISLLWNRRLFALLSDSSLTRISIHPPDIRHARVWRQIRFCIAQAVAKRLAFTYEGWVARQRTFIPAQPLK